MASTDSEDTDFETTEASNEGHAPLSVLNQPSDERLLVANQVSIRYEDSATPVVSEIDFELRAGESVLFLGPSGCGKSTLAMLCAGLIPAAVEAEVDGRWIRHPKLERPGGVGYVFQDADAQFCMLSVGDEVAFGLENVSVNPAEMEPRLLAALREAGLRHRRSSLWDSHSEFSGGMKQKLAIACAKVLDPDLLVFDEPTANLDPRSTHLVFQQIARLHARGQTMIVIEHKFDPLLVHMDRVVLFNRQGQIYRQGPPQEVISEAWNWLMDEGIVPAWKRVGAQSAMEGQVGLKSAVHSSADMNSESANLGPAIEMRNVVVGFGKRVVWSDASLTVPRNSVTAIVGPNGAGKTTLLQTMAGLLKPRAGEVRWFSEPRHVSSHRQGSKIAYCFQNPELQFVFERVGDELANEVIQGPVPESVHSLLKQFGLEGLEQRSPYALSQGQKRRLSVASMLRTTHELYCLDEPTFGQDARTQLAIMTELDRLHQDGKTIVFTTHDMDLVRDYATQVIVVIDGTILFHGTPTDLFRQSNLMQRAHLLSDVETLHTGQGENKEDGSEERNKVDVSSTDDEVLLTVTPLSKLNPAWHLVSIVVTVLLTITLHRLSQATIVFALPMVLMLALGWMNPASLLKRYAVFCLFYVFYLLTYMAYSKIPSGTEHVIHFLWMHADWYGFMGGLILALRMLGAVGFGILFLSNTNLTTFASALSQSMRVPPKFSYGLMAGVHFMPLFQGEWQKLRQSRRLRGREGRFWVRPALYAIPILSQAIRMSERVAIAMEARGFVDDVARHATARTYYREIRFSWWDALYDIGIPVLLGLVLIWLR